LQKQQNIRIVIESLSKLRDVIKKKVLKYIEIRKEAILHLFIEASEFEEFEIDLLIRNAEANYQTRGNYNMIHYFYLLNLRESAIK
jgi:hypothetical protein